MNIYGVRLNTSKNGSDFYITLAENRGDVDDIVCSWSLNSLDFEIYEGQELVDMIQEQYDGTATLSTF